MDGTEKPHTQSVKPLEFMQSQLSSIFDSINEGVYVADTQTHDLLYVNRYIKEVLGRDPVGEKCYRAFQNLDEPCAFCTNDIILERKYEPYEWEYYNTFLDRHYWIVDRVIKWLDGRDVRCEFAIDITQRKKAQNECEKVQQALQDTNEILEKIFSTTYLSIAYLDTDFNYIRVNRAYAQAASCETRHFVGKNYFELYPDRELETIFRQVIQSGQAYTGREREFAPTSPVDKSVTVWDWTLHPVRDGRNEVDGLLLCLSDISERKQAQEKLLNYQKQLRTLASELSLTEERERRRIAADLHDSIGQTLAFTQIKLEMLREATEDDHITASLDDISGLIEQAIKDTHSLMFELSPPILHELGFEAALEWLVEYIQQQHGLPCILEKYTEMTNGLNTDASVVLFRAVRELLINAAKHARPTQVRVKLQEKTGILRVLVEDDGKGFEVDKIEAPSVKTGGYGLFNIKERLEHMGGRLEIKSEIGLGTRMILVLPLDGSKT